MKRALIFSASFVLALWAAPAVAQDSNLTGKYGVTSTAICNVSFGGVSIFTTEGIYTFNGDGTGSATEATLSNNAGAMGSTATNNHSFTFKYTLNHDRSFTLTTDPGSFSGIITSGPNTGLTVSVDQLAPITGFIGIFAQTLTGATLDSPLETVTLSNGNTSTRRCQRSRVFIRVGGE
jgi:hypothetical protein